MKFLKTYEQVKDFYGGQSSKYIIVTNDEKYVMNIYGGKRGAKNPYLYPIEMLDDNFDMFLWDDDLIKNPGILKSFNRELFNYMFLDIDEAREIAEIESGGKGKDGRLTLNTKPYDKDNSFKVIEFNHGLQKVTDNIFEKQLNLFSDDPKVDPRKATKKFIKSFPQTKKGPQNDYTSFDDVVDDYFTISGEKFLNTWETYIDYLESEHYISFQTLSG